MLTKKKILFTIIYLTTQTLTQSIKTILDIPITLTSSSKTVEKHLDFTLSPKKLKTYTISGWLKNKAKKTNIANILTIRNLKEISTSSESISPYPDLKSPKCPFSENELILNPSLTKNKKVYENPNCFLEREEKMVVKKDAFLLIINHDFDEEEKKFGFTFLIVNGFKNERPLLELKGFSGLEYEIDIWVYFCISVDYEKGVGHVLMKEYKEKGVVQRTKEFRLNFEGFFMSKIFNVSLGSRQKNIYYTAQHAFFGEIGYFIVSDCFVDNLEFFDLNFLEVGKIEYKGVLFDFIVSLHEKKEQIKSIGFFKNSYEIKEDFFLLYEIDKEKTGLKLNSKTVIDMPKVDFKQIGDMTYFNFFFEFLFQENLEDDFFLLKRGIDNKNGSIVISLEKTDSGRFVKIKITGKTEEIIWKSEMIFAEKTKYDFFLGFRINLAKNCEITFLSGEIMEYKFIKKKIEFNKNPENIILFGNDKTNEYIGFLEIYRISFLNTLTPFAYKDITKKKKKDLLTNFEKNCVIITSGYKKNYNCLKCQNSILDLNYKCIDYCPFNYKNSGGDICVNCLEIDCKEFPSTFFEIKQIDNKSFELFPNKKILNLKNTDVFDVNIDGLKKKNNDYSFSSKIEEDKIDFFFDFKKNLENSNLTFLLKDEKNPLFDLNRNLVYKKKSEIILKNICFVEKEKKSWIKFFSVIALIIFLITFLLLSFSTIFFYKKMIDLISLWKNLLYIFMKYQLISLLLISGLDLPCCVFEFLNYIYIIIIKWNYGLRHFFNQIFIDDLVFNEILVFKQPKTKQLIEEGVRNGILHNMGITFFIQFLIILVYLGFKIFFLIKNKKSLFIKKVLSMFEFFGLIIVFVFVLPQISVFLAIGIKQKNFDHYYFTINFVICILYVIIFFLFFIYFLINLLKPTVNFLKIKLQKKFLFFLIGYKKGNFKRIFDLLLFVLIFSIGLILGFSWDFIIFQTYSILFILFLIILMNILIRPWIYKIINVGEIISWAFITFSYLFFVIMANNENNGCKYCGDREGLMCFFIILGFFLAMTIPCVFLLSLICKMSLNKNYFMNLKILKNPFYENERKTTKKLFGKKNKNEKEFKIEEFEEEKQNFKKDKNEEAINLGYVKNKQKNLDDFLNKLKNNVTEERNLVEFDDLETYNSEDFNKKSILKEIQKSLDSNNLDSIDFIEGLHDLSSDNPFFSKINEEKGAFFKN